MSDQYQLYMLDTPSLMIQIRKLLDHLYRTPFSVIVTEPSRFVTQKVFIPSLGRAVMKDVDMGGEYEITKALEVEPTQELTQKVLEAILQHHLSRVIAYSDLTPLNEQLAKLFFIDHSNSQTINENIAAADKVIDSDYMAFIQQNIDTETHYLNEAPWRLWELVSFPGNIGFVGGRDYRICEWEDMTNFHDREATTDLVLDMSRLIAYLADQYVAWYRTTPTVAVLESMILAAITRKYPHVRLGQSVHNFQALLPFIDEIVIPSLYTVGIKHFTILSTDNVSLEFGKQYSAVIDNLQRLIITEKKNTERATDRIRDELEQAMLNQDYIPERLRAQYNL